MMTALFEYLKSRDALMTTNDNTITFVIPYDAKIKNYICYAMEAEDSVFLVAVSPIGFDMESDHDPKMVYAKACTLKKLSTYELEPKLIWIDTKETGQIVFHMKLFNEVLEEAVNLSKNAYLKV